MTEPVRLPGESPCKFIPGGDGWAVCAVHGWSGSTTQRSRVLVCPDVNRGTTDRAEPGLREALSDAVKRAGVYEVADAMVFAILDGTFADATEDQVRHAVYELVGRAALGDAP